MRDWTIGRKTLANLRRLLNNDKELEDLVVGELIRHTTMGYIQGLLDEIEGNVDDIE